MDSREGSVHQGTHGNMGNSCHVGLGVLWPSSWAARRDAADALQGAGQPLPQSHSAAPISAVVVGPCSRQPGAVRPYYQAVATLDLVAFTHGRQGL